MKVENEYMDLSPLSNIELIFMRKEVKTKTPEDIGFLAWIEKELKARSQPNPRE